MPFCHLVREVLSSCMCLYNFRSQQQRPLRWLIKRVSFSYFSLIKLKIGRPALPPEPTVQFPAHIIQMLNSAWNADPAARPQFAQILVELEKHTPPEDMRTFSIAAAIGGNEGSAMTDEEDNDLDIEEEFMCASTTVSKLKNQWEQLSVNDGNCLQSCHKRAKTKSNRFSTGEKLEVKSHREIAPTNRQSWLCVASSQNLNSRQKCLSIER